MKIIMHFLRLCGVCLREDILPPLERMEKRMATLEEKLAQVEANQFTELQLHAEALKEIGDAFAAFRTQLNEQLAQIELLKQQIEQGTIGEAANATLDRILANGTRNVEDAEALADLIQGPEVPPPSGDGSVA